MQPLQQGMWKGRRAFIVGGGPSLQGFDWNVLKGELVIALNAGFIINPSLTFVFDLRLMQELAGDPNWTEGYEGIKVWLNYEAPLLRDWPPGVHVLRPTESNDRRSYWSRDLTKGIYRGTNAGSSALNLAELLGADPIYLLGYDFYGDGKRTANWHASYAEKWRQEEAVYKKFLEDFKVRTLEGASAARIYNLNPASALQCFEFADPLRVLPALRDSPMGWRPPTKQDPVMAPPKSQAASVNGFVGLGDTIYMRPCLKRLLAKHNAVYLETPWPQLFWDMPQVYPVKPRNMSLRTQRANAMSIPWDTWRFKPGGLAEYTFGYQVTDLKKGLTPLSAMMERMGVQGQVDFSMAVNPAWEPAWLKDVPRPMGVIHPATVRAEWANPSRCPDQAHLQAIVDAHPEIHWISVAWLEPGQEWLHGEPLRGIARRFEYGQLKVTEMLAVLAAADVAVSGPCFLLPAGAAVGTPTFTVFGGSVPPEALIDRQMGTKVRAIAPEPFCRCFGHKHACNKAIPRERLLGAFAAFLRTHLGKAVAP